jgi:hypothetical protein
MLERIVAIAAVITVAAAVLVGIRAGLEQHSRAKVPEIENVAELDDLHLDLSHVDPTIWVRRYIPDKSSSGYNLVLHRRRVPMLIDMNGNIVHVWPKVRVGARARLNRQGRLAVIERGNLVTEYDWDGNVTWSFRPPPPDFTHHDLIQLSNGHYLVLAMDVLAGRSYLTEVDLDQRVVWRWMSVDHLTEFPGWDSDARNPGHINSISELPPNRWYAAGDERFRPGNILVSARNLNTIFVIDKSSGEVVWRYSERLDFQHEAIMVAEGLSGEGLITVFNNGFNDVFDYRQSHVQAIDPIREEVVWEYGTKYLFSATGGTARRLWGGNTLISSTFGGRVFEIDARGRIVWEWVPPDLPVGRAERVPYDHCPQLAAMAPPAETEVRPKPRGPYVDVDLYVYAPRDRIAMRRVAGKKRMMLAVNKDCRELLLPPGAVARVEFGIAEGDLGGESLTARFRLSIAEGGGAPELFIDVSLDSASEDSWRRHLIRLHQFAYKTVTMCLETEAEGTMDDPMEWVAWAHPKIRSQRQRPAGLAPRGRISKEERKLQKKQLEALGYIE